MDATRTADPSADTSAVDELHAGVFADSPVAMVLLAADAGAIDANAAWCELTAMSVLQSAGWGWLHALRARDRADIRRLVADPAGAGEPLETRLLGPASPRWGRWFVTPIGSATEPGVLITVVDVTADHNERVRLRHAATHDPLTGVANRDLFLDAAHRALARLARNDACVGVLFVDLDGFKTINDGRGHLVGDRVLATQAHRLRQAVRPADLLARVGGDEFAVLCQDIHDPHHLAAIATRVAEPLAAPVPIGHDGAVTVPASVGGAVARSPHTSALRLLDLADGAMYRAKRSGAGPVVVSAEVDHVPTGKEPDDAWILVDR